MHILLPFLLVCLCAQSQSLSWPFSSSSSSPSSIRELNQGFPKEISAATAEFSMERLDDRKGLKLVENARRKLVGAHSCWQNAYRNLFSGCAEIIANKEKQSRLAWQLSDCFQIDSGRSAFPSCDAGAPMLRCLKTLDDVEHKVYLEFFLETNSICHQLQTDAFKHDTERLVNDLLRSAQFAEQKLDVMEEKSEQLLQHSDKVQDSLASINLQNQQLSQASSAVEAQIHDVLEHSKAIFEQSKEIAASQVELQGGQLDMKEKLISGMASLQESYNSLDDGMLKLKEEAVEIEREIQVVGASMSSKMQNLQSKADDIGSVAGSSLEKQKQLLDRQDLALEGLDFLTKFQSQALEESRDTLQRLAELGNKQQEELLLGQEQIQQAHDRLIRNSQSILAAQTDLASEQEEFETKQANIFAALDKLFALHNAILVESRFMKAFFFYSCVIFLLYMLTSTKQTYSIRARLYLGLCTTFVLEVLIVRFGDDDFDQQSRIMSKIELPNTDACGAGNKFLAFGSESDISVSQYSWMYDELPEDVDDKVDPDYILPEEEVGENSITVISDSRKYNLRPRRRQ
ncbi:hypothetical protein C4D60_Mb06t05640 [Musa balbisiana]|uniref:Protein GAMETE EXPRESSED 1 n=1 Tax=Musa balbisiana TaxID=52838 RepID=A0A4S8IKX0_MUSBA|nr:hypothetical protein C4D60_Mb06t05640 [Musa balbisiana]